jgi:DNA-binding protein HU-beta
MNKGELIEVVASRIDASKKDAGEAVQAVVDAITEAVAKGQKVSISGFGVFEQVSRPARTYRKPSTGEAIKKAETLVPKFRPGGEFRAFVAGEKSIAAQAVKAVREAGDAAEEAVRRVTGQAQAPVKEAAKKAAAPAKKAASAAKKAAPAPAKQAAAAAKKAAAPAKKAPAKAAPAAKKAAPAKKAPAKKAAPAAKKAAPAKKSTARKAPAKQAPAAE